MSPPTTPSVSTPPVPSASVPSLSASSTPISSTPAETIDRRAELAAAAYRLIAARGLDGLSMRILARQVGATTGLVTHHFLDRAELIEAALAHATHVMRRRAADAGPDPIDSIGAVLPTDAETVENWRFALTIRAAALVDPDLRSFDTAIHKHWHRYLPDALAAYANIDEHLAASDAVDHLVAVIDGIALRAALQPKKWPAQRQLDHVRRAIASLALPGT